LPEFRWLVEKTEELFLRISLVFQQDSQMFRPLVYLPNLKEGNPAPDPRSWCFGFVEAMMYHRKAWGPLFSMDGGFLAVAPILLTADPDAWGEIDGWNPFKQMAPTKLCEELQPAAQTIHVFWPFYANLRNPIRASTVPHRNDPCPCGSGRKNKRAVSRGSRRMPVRWPTAISPFGNFQGRWHGNRSKAQDEDTDLQ
jgi:uncharacterized protein YecA (UPF0149 family)